MQSKRPFILLKAKLNQSENDLLSELGAYVSKSEGLDLKKLTPGELRLRAERWLELNKIKLIDHICKEWNLGEKAKDPRYADPVFLAARIADIITSLHLKVPPFTVAALLAKVGINRLCK